MTVDRECGQRGARGTEFAGSDEITRPPRRFPATAACFLRRGYSFSPYCWPGRRCAGGSGPSPVPVIMLTAKGEESDRHYSRPRARRRRLRVQAVLPKKLTARVKAVLRRARGSLASPPGAPALCCLAQRIAQFQLAIPIAAQRRRLRHRSQLPSRPQHRRRQRRYQLHRPTVRRASKVGSPQAIWPTPQCVHCRYFRPASRSAIRQSSQTRSGPPRCRTPPIPTVVPATRSTAPLLLEPLPSSPKLPTRR